jgi:mannose-6-phosphate isomerase-like protein (cupin superfamily)
MNDSGMVEFPVSSGVVFSGVLVSKEPKSVKKVWGEECVIVNDQVQGYCGKRMILNACRCSSLHLHLRKKETFYVFSGRMCLEIVRPETSAKDFIVLDSGMSVTLYPGIPHRFYGITETIFFEFSTYDYPSDSVRVEKSRYGAPQEMLEFLNKQGIEEVLQ